MVHYSKPGQPLPFGAALKPDLTVMEVGEYDDEDGMKVVLSNQNMVILVAMEGFQITMGIPIHSLLEAIQTHTRQSES